MSAPTTMDLLVGFYDLTGYMKFARAAEPASVFDLLDGYFALTGAIIAEAGGKFVKAIGDAGLAAFPAADADLGVRAFLALRAQGDAWLARRGYPGRTVVKLHLGPVAGGPLGPAGHRPFDIIGATVNVAATLASDGVALTPAAFRALAPATRTLFKKHTPPVSYIALADRHRD
jgi:class 3 adenylate cyclase